MQRGLLMVIMGQTIRCAIIGQAQLTGALGG